MSDLLQIGDVADLFNISTKTLRHYEKLGLLEPQRSENGYRVYDSAEILQIQRIRNLQRLGLSLRRIKQILSSADGELNWETVLASLLDETESEIAALEARRERLEGLLDSELDSVDPIVVARPEDDARINAYLADYLPEPLLQQWSQDNGVYAMLGTWPNALAQQQTLITVVGYAGPVSAEMPRPISVNYAW